MIKNIARGYRKFISIVGKVLLLAALSLVLGVCIVFPLWKWASSSPKIYSWFVLGLLVAGAVYMIFVLLKKKGGTRFFIGLAKILLVAGGISFSIYMVLNSNRIVAAVVFVLTFVLYGVLSAISTSVLNKRKQSSRENQG